MNLIYLAKQAQPTLQQLQELAHICTRPEVHKFYFLTDKARLYNLVWRDYVKSVVAALSTPEDCSDGSCMQSLRTFADITY